MYNILIIELLINIKINNIHLLTTNISTVKIRINKTYKSVE